MIGAVLPGDFFKIKSQAAWRWVLRHELLFSPELGLGDDRAAL